MTCNYKLMLLRLGYEYPIWIWIGMSAMTISKICYTWSINILNIHLESWCPSVRYLTSKERIDEESKYQSLEET